MANATPMCKNFSALRACHRPLDREVFAKFSRNFCGQRQTKFQKMIDYGAAIDSVKKSPKSELSSRFLSRFKFCRFGGHPARREGATRPGGRGPPGQAGGGRREKGGREGTFQILSRTGRGRGEIIERGNINSNTPDPKGSVDLGSFPGVSDPSTLSLVAGIARSAADCEKLIRS